MLFPYIKRTYVIGILFFVLSLIITLSWFKSGLYYGGAEVGVGPYYHPSRYLDIQKFIWWDSTAPGGLVPQFIAGVPLYFTLSLLGSIFSPLILQAALFFCLLFMMGFGMYLFVSSYLDKNKLIYATIAGLFYMLNSYMMVAVWHRFLYTGFFLAASLPILALFWKLWIDKGKFIFLTLFLLTNLVFVYMYANLTSTLVVWMLCFLLTISRVIFPWQGKKISLNYVFKFLLGLSLFLLTNLWWLIPVFKVSTGVLAQQHTSEDNISTLINISKQTILPFTLQYANPFYLFYTAELGKIYTNFIFLLLPWIPAVVIFIGLLVVLRSKVLASFGLSYLLAILIAKGAANPFGYPYIWGFMNTFFIGVIRNPFEKLGILLPFFGSILFVIGLEALLLICTKKFGTFFTKSIVLTILISILIYAFPMFTGRVFNKPGYPLQVKVPETYNQANDWFKSQKNLQGNILHLPFPSKDVVTYNWEHGYHGVEINEILFTALPSITRNVGIQRVDNTLKSLSFIFNKPFVDNDQILNILQSFNVGYIVLHKETRWDDVSTYGKNVKLNDPFTIEQTLNRLDFLEKKSSFGELDIYKIKDDYYEPKILLSNNYDFVDPGESDIMQAINFSKNSQITSVAEKADDILWENSNKIILFPRLILYNWEYSEGILENILNSSATNPNDVTLPFNQLREVKRRFFSQTGELLSETLINKMLQANKSIVELNKYRINNNIPPKSLLNEYDDQINTIFTGGFDGSSVQRIFSSLLAKVFTLHLYILERFFEMGDTKNHLFAKEIHSKLYKHLVEYKILPRLYNVRKDIEGESHTRVHSYYIPKKASYELLITDNDMFSLYSDILAKLDIKLDGNPLLIRPSNVEDFTLLTEIELDEGTHEISYTLNPSSNLASNLNEFKLEGASQLINNQVLKLTANPHTGSAATLVLDKINGGDTFEVSFEALTDNADKIYLEMIEDTEGDNVVDNCNKTSCYSLMLVSTQKDWQKLSLVTTPLNIASRKVNLRLLLPINQSSTLTSTLQIRNFQINRVMDNNLILRKSFMKESNASSPSAYLTNFRKISPVKYDGKVKLERPVFMFFKETFNPNWILELTHNNKKYRIDKHYLGNLYGNTYYIDKVGEYDFKLEFEPQKYVDYGIITSIAGWIGVLAILIYSEIKRKYESK